MFAPLLTLLVSVALGLPVILCIGHLESRLDRRRSERQYRSELALLRALPPAEQDWYRSNMALTR